MSLKIFSEKKIGGFLSLLFGLLALFEGRKLYPYSKDFLTGDHIFPWIIGMFLLIFGFGLLFERNKDKEKPIVQRKKKRLLLIITLSILFLYCFFLIYLGYAISTFIVSVCLIRIIGNYRWIFSLFTGGLMTIVLYILFITLLRIPFPNEYFLL